MIQEAIAKLIDRQNLTQQEMYQTMNEIMSGDATEAQIAAFLTALRIKGETVDEITGAARAMREKAIKIKSKYPLVVDTCGTGGDRSFTFNISTATAFVTAGAGVPVAKHGNRSVSSHCGSADVLSALGVKIDVNPTVMERCLNEIGIGFLFAPQLHPAMKFAQKVRRELGIRTIFNILGPLTNPADAKAQLLGVFSAQLTEVLANVLKELGSVSAFVVHGYDGLDEITITDTTKVSELRNGKVSTYYIHPQDFGLPKGKLIDLRTNSLEENVNLLRSILEGKTKGPVRDIVVLNAGAAIFVGGGAESMEKGIEKAMYSIDSGAALEKLIKLIELTNEQ